MKVYGKKNIYKSVPYRHGHRVNIFLLTRPSGEQPLRKKKMAENSLVFDLAEALYLQARINKQSDYWSISRLSPKPVSFTNTTFECHRLGGRVNWSEILKNLVRVS